MRVFLPTAMNLLNLLDSWISEEAPVFVQGRLLYTRRGEEELRPQKYLFDRTCLYYNASMKLRILIGILMGICMIAIIVAYTTKPHSPQVSSQASEYWLLYHRTSNQEYLFYGPPGDEARSSLKKTFTVKGGAPGKKPTPLPQLVEREYWLIVDKLEAFENNETAPYFLVLDVPIPSHPPYGPQPYLECGGKQCDWELPGYFGLHGVNGDVSRISRENEGSSGCVRHKDEDITYLYHLLDPKNKPVRYYIKDV